MAPRALEIVKKLKEILISQFAQEILKVVVFGSYATGKETPDSDLDILIVVKDKELEKEIDNMAYKVMWAYNFSPLLSIYVITEAHFTYIKKIRTGFYESIEEDGIEI